MDNSTHKTQLKAGNVYIFDFEAFPNFFYALFLDLSTSNFHTFTVDQLNVLRGFVNQDDLLIGYNNRAYDDVILRSIIDGHVSICGEIYELSQKIIGRQRDDKQLNRYYWDTHPWKEIDLMQVKPPSLTGKVDDWSLKKHQIRLRWQDVRDLPYPFDKDLSAKEAAEVMEYCKNDVLSTKAVFEDFEKQGVFDVARTIAELFDLVANKPFYRYQAQLRSGILSQLYRRSIGMPIGRKIKQPAPTYFEPRLYINEAVAFSAA